MSQPILQVEHLKKYFPAGGRKVLRAVDDVSFSVQEGEILGIVGESGCGKTTCGRTAIGLYSKTDGVSLYRGEDVHRMRGAKRRAFCCQVQTVFQDPYASLDPKNKVIDLIAEGMDIHHLYTGPAERREKVQALMEQVGLNPSGIDRYPYEFSGGMRQRIGHCPCAGGGAPTAAVRRAHFGAGCVHSGPDRQSAAGPTGTEVPDLSADLP